MDLIIDTIDTNKIKSSKTSLNGSITWSEKDRKCLEQLKQFIEDDDSLIEFVEFFDEPFLFSFLKGKKLNVQVAHKTLQNYISIRRNKYLYLFKHLLPSTTESLEKGIIRKLKHKDQHNRFVIVNRTWLWNPKEIGFDDVLRHQVLLMDELLRIGSHQSEEMIVIFDMTGYSLEHAKICTPAAIMLLINLLWKNVPLRFKALHIYNEVWIIRMLIKAIKPFLPSKIRERMHIHSTVLDTLHDQIPKGILPLSLGGPLEEEDAYDDEVEDRINAKEEYYRKFSIKL